MTQEKQTEMVQEKRTEMIQKSRTDIRKEKRKERRRERRKSSRLTAERGLFFPAACTTVLAAALICIFLFGEGFPAIFEIGPMKFLLGMKWRPANGLYGIFPFILGTLCVTAGSALIGIPAALLLSVFLVFYCPRKLYPLCRGAVNLMAGIPSVVYGFFGLMVLVPLMQKLTGADGSTMLTASLLLGIMILPTIAGVTETALRSVPDSCYEGARALGATHERSIFCVVVPAAGSGILAGIVLGIGRSVGETMAVIMVAGNQTWLPQGILKGVRTMTANIVLEMGYAADLHRAALIATGTVLFVFILLINFLLSLLKRKQGGSVQRNRSVQAVRTTERPVRGTI